MKTSTAFMLTAIWFTYMLLCSVIGILIHY